MNRDCIHCAKLTVSDRPGARFLEFVCPELESMTCEDLLRANYGDCPKWTKREVKK